MHTPKDLLLLGAHISIAGGLEKAIIRGESIGCTCIQIFTKSNRQWAAKALTQHDIDAFTTAWRNSKSVQQVVAHAAYLINIGSPNNLVVEKSVRSLQEELHRCQQLAIPYLILHPGAHINGSRIDCLERIAHNLDKVLDDCPGKTMILLENAAGQGSNVGSSFEELAIIYKHVKQKERIAICFDTCHAFAAGYTFSTPEAYQAMWQQFDTTLGLSLLKVIQINDSVKECGSHVDRHEHIGKGKIGLNGFALLMNDARFFHLPKVLETPKTEDMLEDVENMKTLVSLMDHPTRQQLSVSKQYSLEK